MDVNSGNFGFRGDKIVLLDLETLMKNDNLTLEKLIPWLSDGLISHIISLYRLGSDEEKDNRESLNLLLSCTSLKKLSDLYINHINIFEPFRYFNVPLNITVLNGFSDHQSEYDDKIVSDVIIKNVKEILGIDIESIKMIYIPVYNYLLNNGKLYDYICFIGCNNMNFVFQIWDEEVDQDEEIQMKLVEKLPSLLKKDSRIMFFEKNKYQDEFKFHKHLLIESNLSYKLMRKFVTVFKLGYIDPISNRFPYFYHI